MMALTVCSWLKLELNQTDKTKEWIELIDKLYKEGQGKETNEGKGRGLKCFKSVFVQVVGSNNHISGQMSFYICSEYNRLEGGKMKGNLWKEITCSGTN